MKKSEYERIGETRRVGENAKHPIVLDVAKVRDGIDNVRIHLFDYVTGYKFWAMPEYVNGKLRLATSYNYLTPSREGYELDGVKLRLSSRINKETEEKETLLNVDVHQKNPCITIFDPALFYKIMNIVVDILNGYSIDDENKYSLAFSTITDANEFKETINRFRLLNQDIMKISNHKKDFHVHIPTRKQDIHCIKSRFFDREFSTADYYNTYDCTLAIDKENRVITILSRYDIVISGITQLNWDSQIIIPNRYIFGDIDFSGINFSKVRSLDKAFAGYSTNILLLSNLEFKQVISLKEAFMNTIVTDLLDLSYIDFSNVRNISEIFRNAEIGTLDLRNTNLRNVLKAKNMFTGANIGKIIIDKDFDMPKLKDTRLQTLLRGQNVEIV